MGQPSSPSVANATSVRPVQDLSSHAPIIPPFRFIQSLITTHPTGPYVNETATKDSITLTRSVDVESTSSAGNKTTNWARSPGAGSAEAPQAPTVRMSKSAGALLTPLPVMLPRFSADAQRSNSATAHTSLATSATISSVGEKSKSSRLPQFKQSKRWDKFYNSALTRPSLVEESNQKPITAGERSIEEQRLEPEDETRDGNHIHQAVSSKPKPPSFKDDQSIDLPGGLCRPLSLSTWYAVKGAAVSRPRSDPTSLATHDISLRQNSTATRRKAASVHGVANDASIRKVQLRLRLRLKPAFQDLRRRANRGKRSYAVEESVTNSKVIDHSVVREKRSPSLVAILHNPQKFSSEWEATLTNPEFDKDFLTPGEQPMPYLNSNRKSFDFATTANRSQFASTLSTETRTDTINDQTTGSDRPLTAVQSTALQGATPDKVLSAPNPPERTSSKGVGRLAQVASFQRPTYISISPTPRSSALVSPVEVTSGIETAYVENHTRPLTFRQRMASKFSHRSVKGPRHAASTQTLAGIETEAMKSPQLTSVEKLKQTTAFILSPPRRQSVCPSGLPPSGPLPDLPTIASDSTSGNLPVVTAPPLRAVSHDISLVSSPQISQDPHGYERLESGRSSRKSSRRSRKLAATRGLAIRASENDTTRVGPAIISPTSTYSQGSLDSQQVALLKQPFSRHDISNIRSDRSKDVKRRHLDQLKRERRISEEDEVKIRQQLPTDLVPPLPVTLQAQPSIDDLEKFPAVPMSRPQSRTSIRRTQSRTRVHARQTSRSSSIQRAPVTLRQRQALRKSDIKILVDAAPGTSSFRAGAISPSPSMTVSQDGSPMRLHRSSRQGSMQDITNIMNPPNKKTSTRSLKSRGSARRARLHTQQFRRGSGDGELDSEDDINPLVAPFSARASTALSRNKHPNDILTIKVERLEEAIVRIENTLRKQQDVFHMMALAQAGRTVTDKTISTAGRRDSLQVNARKTKDIGGLRPISDISATSVTTDATYGSTTQASAASGEASMTDPFEYKHILLQRPGTAKSKNTSISAVLHRPPPVAQVIPRAKLSEDMSLTMLTGDREWEVHENGIRRLSVNHVFGLTTDMDRSLEALRAMG